MKFANQGIPTLKPPQNSFNTSSSQQDIMNNLSKEPSNPHLAIATQPIVKSSTYVGAPGSIYKQTTVSTTSRPTSNEHPPSSKYHDMPKKRDDSRARPQTTTP